MSVRSQRKEEHLALAQMFFNKKKKNSFDQLHLLRPALPEAKVSLNAIKTKMWKKAVAAPFFIEAMTGGSRKSFIINQQLGQIAAKEKIALALGSASILTKEPDQLDSFYVARQEDPDGLILANINPDTTAKEARQIVKELAADALQIHLNAVQEIAMPEGDRNFYWLDNLKEIRQTVTVPIIIKEVGFGLDQASIHLLKKEGFAFFDVAGSGGTNFAQIENHRNSAHLSYLENLGLPTVIAALMARQEKVNFIVSGGVRNPLDVLKGLALGGKYVGIANAFLNILQTQDQEALQETIRAWKEQLAGLLAVFGQKNLKTCRQIPCYYDLGLKSQIEQLIK